MVEGQNMDLSRQPRTSKVTRHWERVRRDELRGSSGLLLLSVGLEAEASPVVVAVSGLEVMRLGRRLPWSTVTERASVWVRPRWRPRVLRDG